MYKSKKATQIDRITRHCKNALRGTAAMLVAVMLAVGIPCMQADATGTKAGQTENTLQLESQTQQYVIAQDGTGDFMTIQEGVDHASSGDTLIICPGTYTETVQVMNKELNITGVSKELCILQYDTAFYTKAPLTMVAGSVSNLTIYGMDSGIGQSKPAQEEADQTCEEPVDDSLKEILNNYSGYAVHIDQNYLYGRSIRFDNCRILSENNHCVGIGTRGNSTIKFENCEFVSVGTGGCLFMHDPRTEEVSGDTSLIVRDCRMTNYRCPYVMTFQSWMPEYNTMYLTFQNVHVSAVAYEESKGYISDNVNTSFDVETLLRLEKAGDLYGTGFSSTAKQLVHELTWEQSKEYRQEFEKGATTGNYSDVMAISLPEGISYLCKSASDRATDAKKSQETDRRTQKVAKHQVIAIYNTDRLPGNGWCGLDNAHLTADSFGNTLVEMNALLTF